MPTGVIPLILLNKFMQQIDKNLGVNNRTINLLFVGIFFIDKFIRYLKAYSVKNMKMFLY